MDRLQVLKALAATDIGQKLADVLDELILDLYSTQHAKEELWKARKEAAQILEQEILAVLRPGKYKKQAKTEYL